MKEHMKILKSLKIIKDRLNKINFATLSPETFNIALVKDLREYCKSFEGFQIKEVQAIYDRVNEDKYVRFFFNIDRKIMIQNLKESIDKVIQIVEQKIKQLRAEAQKELIQILQAIEQKTKQEYPKEQQLQEIQKNTIRTVAINKKEH